MILTCVFPGKPVPQGSFTPMINRHTGRAFVKNNDAVREHRGTMQEFLAREWEGSKTVLGPVMLRVTFVFSRPKSHYRTGKYSGELKDGAPTHHIQKPDLDKLERLVGDALTKAGVIKDDCQITETTMSKRWCPVDEVGFTVIQLTPLGVEQLKENR